MSAAYSFCCPARCERDADDPVLDFCGLDDLDRANFPCGVEVRSAACFDVVCWDVHDAEVLSWNRPSLVYAHAVIFFGVSSAHEPLFDRDVLADDLVGLFLDFFDLIVSERFIVCDVKVRFVHSFFCSCLVDVIAEDNPCSDVQDVCCRMVLCKLLSPFFVHDYVNLLSCRK